MIIVNLVHGTLRGICSTGQAAETLALSQKCRVAWSTRQLWNSDRGNATIEVFAKLLRG